jgi:hypothetical protein
MEDQDQRKQENKNELLLRHNESQQQEKGDGIEVEDKKAVTVGRHAWLTLAILSSTLLTVFFSETMLLPAIPEIIQDFNISYGTAAWIFSGLSDSHDRQIRKRKQQRQASIHCC